MIPVHSPVFGARELEYAMEALQAGEVSGTAGRFIKAFEDAFAEYCGAAHGVAMNSGTAALHVAAVLANLEPGDEVLVSACTNIASANAVAEVGGTVIPVDSEPVTWNMDTDLLEGLVSGRTRAIMPVHIYGHPVDMQPVMAFARRYGLFVIEDAAEAHGATYRGRKVGSFGDVGCFSFYANKVITTGEGGMLVTSDAKLAARARSLRNLAFAEPRFLHPEVGWNYRMTNLQAALGLGQLERIEDVIAAKRKLAARYTAALQGTPWLRLPAELEHVRSVYWMYCLVVEPTGRLNRDALAKWLHEHGVQTRTMFCPMNLQPALLDQHAVSAAPCPVAEHLWANGLYLPSGHELTDRTVDEICRVVKGAACLA